MCNLNPKVSVQSLSHVWLFVTMESRTPGFPVLHHLPEFAQTHVHWVSDTIQPSHPLSPSSPFAFNPSQHQGLFQWVSSSHQVAKVLSISPTNKLPHWPPSRSEKTQRINQWPTKCSLIYVCFSSSFIPGFSHPGPFCSSHTGLHVVIHTSLAC